MIWYFLKKYRYQYLLIVTKPTCAIFRLTVGRPRTKEEEEEEGDNRSRAMRQRRRTKRRTRSSNTAPSTSSCSSSPSHSACWSSWQQSAPSPSTHRGVDTCEYDADLSHNIFCRIENYSELFILPNFSEWGQFGKMKVGNIVQCISSIIDVIRILTFNIGFSPFSE